MRHLKTEKVVEKVSAYPFLDFIRVSSFVKASNTSLSYKEIEITREGRREYRKRMQNIEFEHRYS